MMKYILIVSILTISIFANETEKMFWDEVKNSGDVQLLKLYKKKYPNGIFESLADIKIKRLKDQEPKLEVVTQKPTWLKGDVTKYRYFGVGKANKHFKGKHYQENLAKKRAKRRLMERLDSSTLSYDEKYEYLKVLKEKRYTNNQERIYILLYIDEDDI